MDISSYTGEYKDLTEQDFRDDYAKAREYEEEEEVRAYEWYEENRNHLGDYLFVGFDRFGIGDQYNADRTANTRSVNQGNLTTLIQAMS